MLRPRPSVNKKVIISALTVILVVASIVIASFTAFGRTTAPKQPDPVINNPADVLDIQQSPPSTPIFDEPEPANPENNETVPADNTPTENPEGAEPVVEPGEPGTEDDSETSSDSAAADPGGEYPSNQESPEGAASAPSAPAQPTITVEKIWSGIRGCMGENPTVNMSLSAANLQELYGFDPAICDSFAAMKSGTIASPEEYLIAKASESNLSIIEQSCQQRQTALMQQWGEVSNYAEMIAAYQVVRSGEYLFFGISPNIAQLVGIFQGMMLAN